ERPERPAPAAEERRDRDADAPRRPRGGTQVFARAAGAVEDEEITGATERLHLAGEDLLEAEVVAGGGDQGGVGGERHRPQGPALGPEADHVLGGDMLGVGRAAAVAGEEEGAPV